MQATESLVDALNHAMDLDVHASARIEFLLGRLQVLLKRDTRAAMWLMTDLQRDPAPRIVTLRVDEPPKRERGVVLADAAELVARLRHEARVI